MKGNHVKPAPRLRTAGSFFRLMSPIARPSADQRDRVRIAGRRCPARPALHLVDIAHDAGPVAMHQGAAPAIAPRAYWRTSANGA
ncbi:hypothetical protein [Sphingomonas quercus]|uniref:Uncharacterized protein n=1 Tax=Sphingomonas quercus TaxID=2842451 RepID=A0ABS6BE39_9SPHN|nr:hypothetical protein [Sphingomonas quercus]MBU3076591.1 hypothetical protein [Sphingomonas quercus]